MPRIQTLSVFFFSFLSFYDVLFWRGNVLKCRDKTVSSPGVFRLDLFHADSSSVYVQWELLRDTWVGRNRDDSDEFLSKSNMGCSTRSREALAVQELAT